MLNDLAYFNFASVDNDLSAYFSGHPPECDPSPNLNIASRYDSQWKQIANHQICKYKVQIFTLLTRPQFGANLKQLKAIPEVTMDITLLILHSES